MTSLLLAEISGLVVSLALKYLPWLSDWYDGQTSKTRALVAVVAMLVVTAVAYGLSCTGEYSFFECSRAGALAAAELFIAALVANQATYTVVRNW